MLFQRLNKMEKASIAKRNGRVMNPALMTMRTKGHFKPRMDWEQREKVLRIVFSKINSSEMPIYWREIDVEQLRSELISENTETNKHGEMLITGDQMKQRLSENVRRGQDILKLQNQHQEQVEEYQEGEELEYGDQDLQQEMESGSSVQNPIDEELMNENSEEDQKQYVENYFEEGEEEEDNEEDRDYVNENEGNHEEEEGQSQRDE